MKILNIHGYKGSPENSAYHALEGIDCKIISPALDYDNEKPENIFGKLSYIVADEDPDIIIGTSFGGFFGAALSAKFNKYLILVNPCLMPFCDLPRLGYESDIRYFVKLFGTFCDVDNDNVCAIVGEDDEALGPHDLTEALFGNSRYRSVPGGRHSGYTLPLKEYFRETIKYFCEKLPIKEDAETLSIKLLKDND